MDGKRKGFLVALVIGLVAAPALALVASGLLGGQAKAGEPVTTSAAVAARVTDVPAATARLLRPTDLEMACTTEGVDLVAGEAAGMLSDLQQAALDSLRPICEAEGFPLEPPPSPKLAAVPTSTPRPPPRLLPPSSRTTAMRASTRTRVGTRPTRTSPTRTIPTIRDDD